MMGNDQMKNLHDAFVLVTNVGPYAALAGAILGGFATLAMSFLSFRHRPPTAPDPTANLEELVRADEVKDSLKQNERVARWAGLANGLLLFCQIVIGGFLASAWVQEQLDKRLIGGLGVLVLLSSLLHQLARPDAKGRGARRRTTRLRSLLREAEDGVFEIQRGTPHAEPIEDLRRRISTKLSEIEATEVDELLGESQTPRQLPPRNTSNPNLPTSPSNAA